MKIWKRFFAAILSAVMIAGSTTGSMSGGMVHAAAVVTETKEKNWYALGRPMTEEEKEEQYELIEYYRSFLGEIPQEEPWMEKKFLWWQTENRK